MPEILPAWPEIRVGSYQGHTCDVARQLTERQHVQNRVFHQLQYLNTRSIDGYCRCMATECTVNCLCMSLYLFYSLFFGII